MSALSIYNIPIREISMMGINTLPDSLCNHLPFMNTESIQKKYTN